MKDKGQRVIDEGDGVPYFLLLDKVFTITEISGHFIFSLSEVYPKCGVGVGWGWGKS